MIEETKKTKPNKRKIITGIILFIVAYLLTIIFQIHQTIDLARGNSYIAEHLFEEIINMIFPINYFGILLSTITVILYFFVSFIYKIYSNIKTKLSRFLFTVILSLGYIVSYYIFGNIILSNWSGWDGLGYSILLVITYLILGLLYIGFIIYNLIQKYRKSKRKNKDTQNG